MRPPTLQKTQMYASSQGCIQKLPTPLQLLFSAEDQHRWAWFNLYVKVFENWNFFPKQLILRAWKIRICDNIRAQHDAFPLGWSIPLILKAHRQTWVKLPNGRPFFAKIVLNFKCALGKCALCRSIGVDADAPTTEKMDKDKKLSTF